MEGYQGIFLVGQPFRFNIKCLVISFAAACIYMLPRYVDKPEKNMFMIAFIFFIVYIMISFYDYLYNCDARMFSHRESPTSIFKPQYRKPPPEIQPGQKYAENQEKAYLRSVYFFHVLIVTPLLLYGSGKAIIDSKKEKGIDKKGSGVMPVIFGMSTLALFYHTLRIFYPRDVWA